MRITQRVNKILDGYEGDPPAVKGNLARILTTGQHGRRIVLFSGGKARDLDGVLEEIRGLRDGRASGGSIIGRNTFQRPKEQALDMPQKIIDIHLSKD